MKKMLFSALCSLLLCHALVFPVSGECSETWEIVSNDFKNFAEKLDNSSSVSQKSEPEELVEIEYDGKLIKVDIDDLILMADGEGGQKIDLGYPEKYADQLRSARQYGVGLPDSEPDFEFDGLGGAMPAGTRDAGEITASEYEDEQRARRWADVFEDLTLRQIDEKALELVKEYGEAKGAVPPSTGVSGSVVITYSSYTPKIVCRPMYVTDIILQPGEAVTGVHPGDSVRWTFVPSKSGSGEAEQTHVLIKPLMADISTNVIVNTDRRTYQLDLMSSAKDFMPSVSFNYPDDSAKAWSAFMDEKRKERENSVSLASGYSVNPEDLHLDYEIRGKDSLRWKPVRVWDDGIKTYIQFKRGAAKRSVEAPVLVVFEHKKEVLANYRAAEDMYVVDRIFDKAALIAGTGAQQDRVVLTRLGKR
ncbi:MAG: P-type conjugative transfer protein TrbG [Synergistaceae bacterium]|nr:P-type conjugative transfer protein TrbG [Synergistaceae bacterium]